VGLNIQTDVQRVIHFVLWGSCVLHLIAAVLCLLAGLVSGFVLFGALATLTYCYLAVYYALASVYIFTLPRRLPRSRSPSPLLYCT
jgi:hypothetical protein